jgi:lipid-A-disaccharide synthase
MINVSRKFPGYEFVIAGAPSLPEEYYRKYMNGSDMKILFRQTYNILEQAHAAMVTSGTATLEAALFRVPEVVCYAGGAVSYAIARSLVNSNLKYISLVNLILDREVVKELIQKDLTEEKLERELSKLLDGEGRVQMLKEYEGLEARLGGPGASEKVAGIIHADLTGSST